MTPIRRHHRMRLALAGSAAFHGAVFLANFSSPPSFAVQQGPARTSVKLRLHTPSENQPLPPKAKAPVPPAVSPKASPTAAPTIGGADAEARPDYMLNPAPEYPALSRTRGEEGTVWVEAEVGADGRCASARVQKSSGHLLLDEAAVAAVRDWTFRPATRLGRPVASVVIIPVRFRLVDLYRR